MGRGSWPRRLEHGFGQIRVAFKMMLLHVILFGVPLLAVRGKIKIGSASYSDDAGPDYLAFMVIMAWYTLYLIQAERLDAIVGQPAAFLLCVAIWLWTVNLWRLVGDEEMLPKFLS